MCSYDFSLFITPLKLGSRWILETGLLTHNLHFPEGKHKKALSLPRGTHLCGFLSLIWQVIVLQYGRLRWHHHSACNRPLLVFFNMCCWFWTRCMKYRDRACPLWQWENPAWGQKRFRGRFHHLTTGMQESGWSEEMISGAFTVF